jgi:hypothetical protein
MERGGEGTIRLNWERGRIKNVKEDRGEGLREEKISKSY